MTDHLTFFLQNGPVVVFSSNLDWSPRYISPNIETVFGFVPGVFFTEPHLWVRLLHPDDKERVQEALASLPSVERVALDSRMRHADGGYVHVRSVTTLVRNDQGEPDHFMGFFVDLTNDISQQKKIATAHESLEQFVYVASHDLREPLIGIAGYATLVARRYGDVLDEAGGRYLNEIVQGCKAMEQKIDDLLELSRAGREASYTPFPLGAAIEQARRSLAGSIGMSGATIRHDSLPMVVGDRSQIAQVFQNLFSNSIKYRAKEAAPVIDVTIEPYEEDPNWVNVAVRDNGIGFDMRHAERIFGVFQRLYTVEQYPGTGIGLAIVKKTIERHGGKIWVQSKPGDGTTFYFTLAKPDE